MNKRYDKIFNDTLALVKVYNNSLKLVGNKYSYKQRRKIQGNLSTRLGEIASKINIKWDLDASNC